MSHKLAVFGLVDTLLFPQVKFSDALYTEVKEMLQVFKQHSIKMVVLSKRQVRVGTKVLDHNQLNELLKTLYDIEFEIRITPNKTTNIVGEQLKADHSLESKDIIYIGNSEMDFRAAVNYKFLFLNACWNGQNINYGILFDTPSNLLSYLNVFSFKNHYWQFQKEEPIKFRSMAVCSTYYNEYRNYSGPAINSAKKNHSHKDFFLKQLVSSNHFSGLFEDFDYITSYPGHNAGTGNQVMEEMLDIMGKFYRKNYIPNLIIRHTKAQKLQYNRNNNTKEDNFLNQLNTICLNKTPKKSQNSNYANFANTIRGKRILVVDDFCTEGTSLEAARVYIEKAGGKAVLLSWLKFISKSYIKYNIFANFNPFQPTSFSPGNITNSENIPYHTLMADNVTHVEFSELYDQYCKYY